MYLIKYVGKCVILLCTYVVHTRSCASQLGKQGIAVVQLLEYGGLNKVWNFLTYVRV